jgi:hypothetical protein
MSLSTKDPISDVEVGFSVYRISMRLDISNSPSTVNLYKKTTDQINPLSFCKGVK